MKLRFLHLQTKRLVAQSAITRSQSGEGGTTRTIAPRLCATSRPVNLSYSLSQLETSTCVSPPGLATSTTKLSELSDDCMHHHNQLSQKISREQIHDAIAYVLRKLLQDYPLGNSPSNDSSSSSDDHPTQVHHPHHGTGPSAATLPTVHLRFFYQVGAIGSVQALLEAIESFLSSPSNVARIAYTVVPACHLQNFSTFISICGLRHHE